MVFVPAPHPPLPLLSSLVSSSPLSLCLLPAAIADRVFLFPGHSLVTLLPPSTIGLLGVALRVRLGIPASSPLGGGRDARLSSAEAGDPSASPPPPSPSSASPTRDCWLRTLSALGSTNQQSWGGGWRHPLKRNALDKWAGVLPRTIVSLSSLTFLSCLSFVLIRFHEIFLYDKNRNINFGGGQLC